MDEPGRVGASARIMSAFAERTGLASPTRSPQRYLWTDAFALCNLLSLYRRTDDETYRQLAIALVEQVHHVLGRHREDDGRRGWISALDDAAASEHPTAGGLRIGKPQGERRPDEPYDDRAEWDRDGQYFHYLTKWMHALCRTAEVTEEPRYCRWAVELAKAAHAGFRRVDPGTGRVRLAWKMSIDLSRPLVPFSGLHDALDAWVSYQSIAGCAEQIGVKADLEGEIAEAGGMLAGGRWQTDDPLGIGGLLLDTWRLVRLLLAGRLDAAAMAVSLARASLESLEGFTAGGSAGRPAEHRLAFRELGLAIGLRGVPCLQDALDADDRHDDTGLRRAVEGLGRYVRIADELEAFWLVPDHQRVRSWQEHRDINEVMLATSLLPDEFLAR